MRECRAILGACAFLLFAGCDIEVDNSAPAGPPPSSSNGADTSASGATAGDGSATGTPVAPADPGAGTSPGTGPGTTPPPAGGTPPPAGGTPPAAAPVTHVVKLLNMQYADATSGSTKTTIKVGDSVVWQNVDSMDHTTTSDPGAPVAWDAPLAQRTSFTFTFTKAGTYPYSCLKHKSTMKGTVVVQ